MTLITGTFPPDMASDATFRTWGKAICDNLIALGWTRASDTGNINWATVTKPASANTPAGWEIFCMNDSLQATKPVFIKLEFGCGGSTTNPSVWITGGTGSNGSGTLTGQIGTRWQCTNSSSGATIYTSRFSGASNRFVFTLWQNGTNSITISVERTHDSGGADTDEAFMIITHTTGGAMPTRTQYIPFLGTIPTDRNGTNHPCVVPAVGTGASGGDVYLFPYRIWGLVGESCPSLNLFCYFNADLTANNPVTATLWDGSSHSIYPSGALQGFNGSLGGICVIAYRND